MLLSHFKIMCEICKTQLCYRAGAIAGPGTKLIYHSIFRFFNRLQFYYKVVEGSDVIYLFNYCFTKTCRFEGGMQMF